MESLATPDFSVSPQEKIILDYTEIHWHDSVIRKVVELPAEEKLLIEVDYPVDWENQKWEPHIIEFANLHTYEIHEGPFAGSPTILDATKSDIDKYGNGILVGPNKNPEIIDKKYFLWA